MIHFIPYDSAFHIKAEGVHGLIYSIIENTVQLYELRFFIISIRRSIAWSLRKLDALFHSSPRSLSFLCASVLQQLTYVMQATPFPTQMNALFASYFGAWNKIRICIDSFASPFLVTDIVV